MTQGQRIKKIRLAMGLPQEDFGKIFEIPKQMVSSLEKDRLKLNNDKLVKLLCEFNININYLLSGRGSMFVSADDDNQNCTFIELEPNQILKIKYKEK